MAVQSGLTLELLSHTKFKYEVSEEQWLEEKYVGWMNVFLHKSIFFSAQALQIL